MHGEKGSELVGFLRRVLPDLGPLRESRDFRFLWSGEAISQAGSQITVVALYVQVFRLTHSSLAVGAIGLVQLVPLVLGTLVLGPVIDAVDRRRLLLVMQAGQLVGSSLLFGGAVAGRPPLVLVFVAAGLVAGFGGGASSIGSSLTPNLVRSEQLPAALSINQVMFNTAMIVGPGLGGVLIGTAGLATAYGVDVVSFAAAIAGAALIAPRPPILSNAATNDERRTLRVAAGKITEGFRYLRGRPVLWSTFVVDLVAMIFGMPRALFPVLALQRFHGGAGVVGGLLAAASAGALLASLTTGWVGRISRQGLAVLIAVGVWGAGIVVFGLCGSSLVVAVAALAVAGGADVISAVYRGTILQRSVPDDLRGRMSSVHILVVTGGPRLGDFEAGAVASLWSPTASVVSGGVLCILGVLVLAWAVPEFATTRFEVAANAG